MPVRSETFDGVTVITLQGDSGRRNALDLSTWHALRDAAQAADGARVVVLTGSDGHFCAGMDLAGDESLAKRMRPALYDQREGPARALLVELKACIQAVADLPVPTIAAIEGACVGGGLEIALACDMRFAAADASLGLPEVRAGMVPDLGGCARLARLVGPGRAADLICTARLVGGEEALRMGLVERVVPGGGALNAARETAAQIVANAPLAVRLALNVVRLAPDLGLAEALSVETRAGVMALTSGEPREGIAAFLEKRAPRWNG